jgi:hypothetical protein
VIYYANPTGEAARDAMSAGRLGCIITPRQRLISFPDDGWDVMADNGCFSDRWNHAEWFRWMLSLPRTVRFLVAPDVYDPTGGPSHLETLERWRAYGPLIERHGFTPAFVCQIGATPDTIPDDAPVLFLGGSTAWKLGPVASAITSRARAQGRWVHMGRVNSELRLTAARSMGCHSVDGTYLIHGPDRNLPKLLAWLERAERQPMLFE